MELDVLPSADFLPNGCSICHTHAGPFVVVRDVRHLDVRTAEGLAVVHGPVAFCVGRDGDLGCARLIGLAAGELVRAAAAADLEAELVSVNAAYELATREIADLTRQLEDARANVVQVVPVNELLDKLAAGVAA